MGLRLTIASSEPLMPRVRFMEIPRERAPEYATVPSVGLHEGVTVGESSAAVAEPEVVTKEKEETKKREKPRRQPPYHVILWDDDDHSYAYVITMLQELFAHPPERGFQLAKEVDAQGKVVVCTTTRERAELKRDQIHAYGKDDMIAGCKGSMKASIEPSE